jgi:riboflavin kinase/FMN adenylyltransferase
MLIPESVVDVTQEVDSMVTVGVFDGVHLGHKKILDKAVGLARSLGLPAIAVTFDPTPREVLGDPGTGILTTIAERATLIEETGIDRLVVIPFSPEFAHITAVQFVQEILRGRLSVREMTIGYNHSFGYRREGNPEMLRTLGQKLGFGVQVVDPHLEGGLVVSTTAVKEALGTGRVEEAAQMLGRSYVVSGRVVVGDGRGRLLGFPTANIVTENDRKILPLRGVYAVRVRISGEMATSLGMMNIGTRPTVTSGERLVAEVHLLDFEGDLYGKGLTVAFQARLRDEVTFATLDDLKRQLAKDRTHCRRILDVVS